MSAHRFSMRPRLLFLAAMLSAFLVLALPLAASAQPNQAGVGFYRQTNLVSDLSTVGAKSIDPNLKNPWGIVAVPGLPFWVSDNNAGVSTLYDGQGNIVPLVVGIPGPDGTPAAGAPTGVVFNSANGFNVSENGVTAPARFIFDTEDGTIAGWSPTVDGHNAILAVNRSQTVVEGKRGAVYKGLALGSTNGSTFLYASNFRFGTVDVFDSQFNLTHLSGSFTDNKIPSSYAPFGIRNIDNKLYVTYAKQDDEKHDDVAGPGRGFVDVFDLNGNLLQRFAEHGTLNSPWGLELAPDGFGQFSHALLVGNFGDGTINAFNPQTGAFLGQLTDATGAVISIDDLWGLTFGNGARNSDPHTLYFTAGINDEMDGLFGFITAQG